MKVRIIVICSVLFCLGLNAQIFERTFYPLELEDGTVLENNVGGLNCAQYSTLDANNDGLDDLFVFDRVGDVPLVFLAVPDGNSFKYEFSQAHTERMPPLSFWTLLRDYNKDGAMDLFTGFPENIVSGIKVYKGYYRNDTLLFEQLKFPHFIHDVLTFSSGGSFTNIYVSNVDIPSLDDIDNDGDLYVLSFGSSGTYVNYYKNTSVERGMGSDTLIFFLDESCWGNFLESGISSNITLGSDTDECPDALSSGDGSPRHAGSTLLSLDIDGDRDRDLLVGDLTNFGLTLLTNGGTLQDAFMTDVETSFPSNSLNIDINQFVSAFYLDLDFDGKRDLLAGMNEDNTYSAREINWFYKNIGDDDSPQFSFVQNDFLEDQMLEIGQGAYPIFVDLSGDGKMDLLIGNESNNGVDFRQSRLYYFQNVGTLDDPIFRLEDDDYLGFSKYDAELYAFAPAAGDLDGDGDVDLVVGESEGRLFFVENIAQSGSPASFGPEEFNYQGIDGGQYSTPFIVDLDEDGLMDLVVGQRNPELNFYKNQGSVGNPFFDSDRAQFPNTRILGRVRTVPKGIGDTGYSAPFFFKIDDRFNLISGSNRTGLFWYDDIEGNLYDEFNLIGENIGNLREGNLTNMDMADIDNDGLYEMVVGNRRGGISFYNTIFEAPVVSSVGEIDKGTYSVFPNPATDFLTIDGIYRPDFINYQIYSVDGKELLSGRIRNNQVDISSLNAGIYFIKIIDQNATISLLRFVKI